MRDECVVHADETRLFRGTQVYWLWALVSEHPRYVLTHHSRGMAAAELLIGASKVIVVTDRAFVHTRRFHSPARPR